MLACARIGAIHSVVYGGFSVESLTERIEDSQSRVLVVADGAYQRGKIVPLKEIADEALQRAGTVEHVVVVKRTGEDVFMQPGRDMWYHELVQIPHCTTTIVSCRSCLPRTLVYTLYIRYNRKT
jgi:acetyl-CoA synthetase